MKNRLSLQASGVNPEALKTMVEPAGILPFLGLYFLARPSSLFYAGALTVSIFGVLTRLYLTEFVSYILPPLVFVSGVIIAGLFSAAARKKAIEADNREESPSCCDGALIPQNSLENGVHSFVPNQDAGQNIIPFRLGGQPDMHREFVLNELGAYPRFTDILSKQMTTVTDISEGAAKDILENLTNIDDQITSLLKFIQQSGSNDQAAHVVEEIEKQTQECRDLLELFTTQQEAGAQNGRLQRSKIVTETGKVLEVLDGVNGVARQTTMLSFNVSIEAARAGEAGRGFAIIGEEIRKLASEVQDLAKEVRERVESLTQIVTVELQQEAEKRDRTERLAIANIGATLNALTDNLLTLITHQRDIMAKVESGNESVARPILGLMGSIQFQDIIRQQLQQLVTMADMVSDHLCTVSRLIADPETDIQIETLSQKLDNIFKTYVMESQRANHRSVEGQSAAQETCARIELF